MDLPLGGVAPIEKLALAGEGRVVSRAVVRGPAGWLAAAAAVTEYDGMSDGRMLATGWGWKADVPLGMMGMAGLGGSVNEKRDDSLPPAV